jgi:hypothetical protein
VAAREALEVADFAEIDYALHEGQIKALRWEQRQLEENNTAIRPLKQRLGEAESRQRKVAEAAQLLWGTPELDRNAEELVRLRRGAGSRSGARTDAHQFLQSLDLFGLNPDSSLALGATLEIRDRDGPAAEHELSGIREAEPVVERRPGNAEAVGSFCG